MSKKKAKKEETKVEEKTEEVKKEETTEVKTENSSENPTIEIQECPSEACQELQDIWASGKGCYNSASKYCKSCGDDFPATKQICEKRTLEAAQKVADSKVKAKTSKPVKVGFGHKQGTQAAGIDLLLQAGTTKADFLKRMNEDGYNKNHITDYDMWMRILTHFRDLKENHGIVITKDNGIYKGTVATPAAE